MIYDQNAHQLPPGYLIRTLTPSYMYGALQVIFYLLTLK